MIYQKIILISEHANVSYYNRGSWHFVSIMRLSKRYQYSHQSIISLALFA
jgi:hypothetical protein